MTYREIVDQLDPSQINRLVDLGIARSTVSEWRSGKRKPTAKQAKLLAIVAMVDFHKLIDELVELEATPEQLTFFRAGMARAVNRLSALGAVILSGAFLLGAPTESRAVTTQSSEQPLTRMVGHSIH